MSFSVAKIAVSPSAKFGANRVEVSRDGVDIGLHLGSSEVLRAGSFTRTGDFCGRGVPWSTFELSPVSLKQSQKNKILEALIAAGVDPERFSWQMIQKLDRPKPLEFPKGTTVLKGKDSHWFMAIAEDRTAWWGPSSQCSTWTLKGQSFEQLMTDAVIPWSRELKNELEQPDLWPEECQARDHQYVLLPSQQNEVYRALIRNSVDLSSARWHRGSNKTTLLHLGGGKYTLRLDWSLDPQRRIHLWSGDIRPGEDLPYEPFSVRGWEAMAPVIDRWARFVAEEQKAHANPPLRPGKEEAARGCRLLSIRLKGIRSFQDVQLSFHNPDGSPRMITLLIGENGTGKTTLLRALALATCPKADANVLLSMSLGSMLGAGSESGTIEIEYGDPNGVHQVRTLEIRRVGRHEEVEEVQGSLPRLFAYGSGVGRSMESADVPTSREYRPFQSMASLFDYRTALANPELVLKRLRDSHPEEFDSILTAWVGALGLPLGTRVTLPKDGGVEVQRPSGPPISLTALADGYRLTFGWMLDLHAWAAAAGQPRVGELCGLLLIDEIEQHLHPTMQSRVIERMRLAYPELQIIATTHSPLVALGTATGELFRLDLGEKGTELNPGPVTAAMSVEDLVTSEEGFDAPAYGPATAELLSEYDRLVAVKPEERDGNQRSRLTELSGQLTAIFKEVS